MTSYNTSKDFLVSAYAQQSYGDKMMITSEFSRFFFHKQSVRLLMRQLVRATAFWKYQIKQKMLENNAFHWK